MVFDIYIWLAYRLHALQTDVSVSWPSLYAQFGAGYRRLRDFRAGFAEGLELALGQYEFDGQTLITHVDGASRPEAFGDQVRQVKFEGPDRVVLLPPPSASGARQELTWDRVG